MTRSGHIWMRRAFWRPALIAPSSTRYTWTRSSLPFMAKAPTASFDQNRRLQASKSFCHALQNVCCLRFGRVFVLSFSTYNTKSVALVKTPVPSGALVGWPAPLHAVHPFGPVEVSTCRRRLSLGAAILRLHSSAASSRGHSTRPASDFSSCLLFFLFFFLFFFFFIFFFFFFFFFSSFPLFDTMESKRTTTMTTIFTTVLIVHRLVGRR